MTAIPTPHPSPVPQLKPGLQEDLNQTALVQMPPEAHDDPFLRIEGSVAQLPVQLDVGVPIRDFRVRNLLALEPGSVVASQWTQDEDLPVLSGNQALAWSEFEVVDSHLAVRLTRLP